MASSWASYLLHYLVTFTSFAQDYERAGAPESKQFLLFSKLLHCCCSCWFCYCCCTNLHDLWLCIASQTNQVTQLTSQTQTEPKPSQAAVATFSENIWMAFHLRRFSALMPWKMHKLRHSSGELAEKQRLLGGRGSLIRCCIKGGEAKNACGRC